MWDRVAFAALVKRKRGEKGLTQETLALDVFGDPGRKGDISRIENARVEPQEATIQKLCSVLEISDAEMEPVRQGKPIATQLDNIPAMSRERMEDLAARFGVDDPYGKGDAELRAQLRAKADEYRALKTEVDAIDDGMKQLANLKAAAQDAIARFDLEEVEEVLSAVQHAELNEAAKTAELRADNALLRGKTQQAYELLVAAANSFAAVNPDERITRLLYPYSDKLWDHALRFGGDGAALALQAVESIEADVEQHSNSTWHAHLLVKKGLCLAGRARRTGGTEGSELFGNAVAAYRAALEVHTRAEMPLDWAMTQNNLGAALREQGSRIQGPEGAALLGKAVTAYRAALEVHTRAEMPVDWAGTQNNLGIALSDQGKRIQGPEGAALLGEAVTAFRAALEVRTRAELPVQWATTQNNLGNTLLEQGIRSEGPEGAALLGKAVTAYRAALEVHTRAEMPVDWAGTQNNLGIALSDQGKRIQGPEGAALLGEAVTAFRAALEVRTRAEMPVQWAMTQNNLGIALQDQGSRSEGPEGAALLGEAVTAYRATLEVYTRAEMPVDWAMTQENLALAEEAQAKRAKGAAARAHLTAALAHVDGALEVYDPEHMSYDHGTATQLRARIVAALEALDGA